MMRRLTLRTAALAFVGVGALLLLSWGWLYVPDSHIYQLLFSALLGLLLIAGFCSLLAEVARRIRGVALVPLWQGALLCAGWLLLGFFFQQLLGHLHTNVETRAGYWNSQLSHAHRVYFTYERLITWQNLVIEALQWIAVPALLLPFAVETVSAGFRPSAPRRTANRTLARPQFWLTVAVAYTAGSWLSGKLLGWMPGHSVAGELFSLALRILIVYTLAIALLLITLAVTAELLSSIAAKLAARNAELKTN